MSNMLDQIRALIAPTPPAAPENIGASSDHFVMLDDPPAATDDADTFDAAEPGAPGPWYQSEQPGGGYPMSQSLISRETHALTPPRMPSSSLEVIQWTSARYNMLAGGPAVLVTPAGIDAQYVRHVQVLVNDASAVRVGPTDNGAAAGGFLPPGVLVDLFAGPVWLSCLINTVVDVFVYFATPAGVYGAPAAPCGCHDKG